MSRLAEDIAFLQRAADTAGLIIYPGKPSKSFPEKGRAYQVSPQTLGVLADQLEALRLAPREYQLIGYEAVWLLRGAQQLALYLADGDTAEAEHYRRIGEYLRGWVEFKLVNAGKSLEALA